MLVASGQGREVPVGWQALQLTSMVATVGIVAMLLVGIHRSPAYKTRCAQIALALAGAKALLFAYASARAYQTGVALLSEVDLPLSSLFAAPILAHGLPTLLAATAAGLSLRHRGWVTALGVALPLVAAAGAWLTPFGMTRPPDPLATAAAWFPLSVGGFLLVWKTERWREVA